MRDLSGVAKNQQSCLIAELLGSMTFYSTSRSSPMAVSCLMMLKSCFSGFDFHLCITVDGDTRFREACARCSAPAARLHCTEVSLQQRKKYKGKASHFSSKTAIHDITS
ncbi:hypothetical protein BT93_C0098 [Corymbia citriodora subsp. variegata]|nr:hypothetical protein BT93_C0098 [Corymbia citriodora subsp. variegata]